MNSSDWPRLAFREWEKTCDTLHMWTQIVGKTSMEFAPLVNHWWNVALYVTPRGLTTSAIPYHHRTFDVEFDFIAHMLVIRSSNGNTQKMQLFPRSVADFYNEYMACLKALEIEAKIDLIPAEFDDSTPHDQDHHHASYDIQHIDHFRQILIGADHAFKKFRAPFLGKCSPVHFFWGSFDLAVTRFSGRRSTLPDNVDLITREAYSHEVMSCGFWPGNRGFEDAAFYSYIKPAPTGIEKANIRPMEAAWNDKLGEFILKYDDIRAAPSPEQAIIDFCQSTYEAGANLGHWDRASLERAP